MMTLINTSTLVPGVRLKERNASVTQAGVVLQLEGEIQARTHEAPQAKAIIAVHGQQQVAIPTGVWEVHL